MTRLSALDWTAIAAYLGVTLMLGTYFRRRAGGNTEDYFLSGRQVSWWLAGTSMVATTFAADTPLVVTGLVYTQGVAGNWLWWSFLPSGMLTVFLFARLWRRSGLLTDAEFSELRYSGKPAAFLRCFRAIYFGIFINCLILGWVTKAMVTIVSATLGVTDHVALAVCLFFLMPFTGVYVSMGGLWGVLWTDVLQFFLKMTIVIAVSIYAVRAVGGMDVLLVKLSQARHEFGPGTGDPTAMLPSFSQGLTAEDLWTIPLLTFFLNLGIQWWAVWYPGAEPGGGSYIAQRIFSARNERHGILSVLWFNVAHYALRPWPWIVTALATIILYPGLKDPEAGYMLVVTRHMPHAWRGIVIAGFMAAFMSTIATYLNWGASYIIGDFYRRFVRKNAVESHYVAASRIATILLVVAATWVSAQLNSIRSAWELLIEIGAGTGGVYLLRWYWWRINAWSEISASITALVLALLFRWNSSWSHATGGAQTQPFTGAATVVFTKTALTTTFVTTLVWLIATLLTPPESNEVLDRFYRRVRPDARGWLPIARDANDVVPTRDLGRNLVCWILGCGMVYCALFCIGKFVFHQFGGAVRLLTIVLAFAVGLYFCLSRSLNLELQGRSRKLP
jgi:solute:Na+ symporter, SSS family